MEDLFKELIEVLKSNSIVNTILIISGAVTAIAALITAIISLLTIKNNKATFMEMQKSRLISLQKMYPLIKINRIDQTLFMDRHNPTNSILISKMTCEGFDGISIIINNGVIASNNKPYFYYIFNLTNCSEAIIKQIKLLHLSVMKPQTLQDNTMKLTNNPFKTNDILSSSTLIQNDSIQLCIQVFLDNEKYIKYFDYNNFILTAKIEIEVITGVKFYEYIVLDGGKSEYYCSENEEELTVTCCVNSSITLNK